MRILTKNQKEETMKNDAQITNQADAVKHYQDLYSEHCEKMNSCDQSNIDRCQKIQAEQAKLERDFPGTLEEWINQD